MGAGGLAKGKSGQDFRILYAGSGVAVAAGAGDNTAVTGETIDRCPVTRELGAQFDGAELVIVLETTIAIAETLTMAFDLEHAPEHATVPNTAGTFANVETADALASCVITAVAAGTVKSVIRRPIKANDLKRFMRCNVTPNLSAGATDVVRWTAAIHLYEPHNGIPFVQADPTLP